MWPYPLTVFPSFPSIFLSLFFYWWVGTLIPLSLLLIPAPHPSLPPAVSPSITPSVRPSSDDAGRGRENKKKVPTDAQKRDDPSPLLCFLTCKVPPPPLDPWPRLADWRLSPPSLIPSALHLHSNDSPSFPLPLNWFKINIFFSLFLLLFDFTLSPKSQRGNEQRKYFIFEKCSVKVYQIT